MFEEIKTEVAFIKDTYFNMDYEEVR